MTYVYKGKAYDETDEDEGRALINLLKREQDLAELVFQDRHLGFNYWLDSYYCASDILDTICYTGDRVDVAGLVHEFLDEGDPADVLDSFDISEIPDLEYVEDEEE